MSTLSPGLTAPGLTGTDEGFQLALPGVTAAIRRSNDGAFHSLDLTIRYRYEDSPILLPEGPVRPGRPTGSVAPDARRPR